MTGASKLLRDRKIKRFIAGILALILLTAILASIRIESSEGKDYNPNTELLPDYIIVTERPSTDEQRVLTVGLSSLAVKDGKYHPLFFVDSLGLDDHQLWTIEHLKNNDVPYYIFYFSHENIPDVIQEQLKSIGITPQIVPYRLTSSVLKDFKGFRGIIYASTYEEALWIVPLAQLKERIIIYGKQTFRSQEDVWEALKREGLDAKYVVVTNPEDWQDMNSHFFDVNGNEYNLSFHVKDLSLLAAQIAAFRQGYVFTDISPPDELPEEFDNDLFRPPYDPDRNLVAIHILMQIREIDNRYGPIENIALIGSPEAVPQFSIQDYYSGLPEPDGVQSDSIYGFLDADPFTMDAAVGRIVNLNLKGGSNMIVRTLAYERIMNLVRVPDNDAQYGGEKSEWRHHAAAFNGFEVADQRLQNTPGWYFYLDAGYDEDYTAEYYTTLGPGGGMGWTAFSTNTTIGGKIPPALQASGIVAYRGHGSWHGCFYQWGYYIRRGIGIGDENYTYLEGRDARYMFLPPQVTLLFSCENAKIQGLNFRGDPITFEDTFALNYLYAGAVGYIAATEVSFSNVGQDLWSAGSPITGEGNWDLNNLWFAGTVQSNLDRATGVPDSEFETTIGEAHRLTENRYMAKHPGISPIVPPQDPDNDAPHWKEVTMYVLYGDPAFMIHVTKPGPNNFDPWN